MLVLSRKLQQQIRIGDNITLTVLKVKGNTVRLGIEAPREVRVMRTELPLRDELPLTDGVEAQGSGETLSPPADADPNTDEPPFLTGPLARRVAALCAASA